jgi:hypothetical protein
MEFGDDERELLLAALFELKSTQAEGVEKGEQFKALVERVNAQARDFR